MTTRIISFTGRRDPKKTPKAEAASTGLVNVFNLVRTHEVTWWVIQWSQTMMCEQYNLLGHGQRVGEGGVETVGVKPAEVLHLSIVKIRIQVIHRHLIGQIGQRGLFGGFIISPPALKVKQWKGEGGNKPNNTFWWTPRKSLWVSGAGYLMKSVISCVWQSQML